MPPLLSQPKLRLARPIWKRLINFVTPRQSHQAELLDAPDQPKAALAGTFRDLRLINRWFGGRRLVESCLRPHLPPATAARLHLLDLASGVSDIPLALARDWQKRGLELEITALDLNPTIVELAEEAAQRQPNTAFKAIAADVFAYPWPSAQQYDFVTCSLAFHHFEPGQCVEMLELMSRLTRRTFVVNDLRRTWGGWLGAKLLCLTLTRHPVNRHDAPLSILRSFTQAEMLALVEQANFDPAFQIEVRRQPFSRLSVVGYRKTSNAEEAKRFLKAQG